MTYIGHVLQLLKGAKYHGAAEEIQIAMGKHYLPKNLTEAIRKITKQWL